jgi:hypothetical protein
LPLQSSSSARRRHCPVPSSPYGTTFRALRWRLGGRVGRRAGTCRSRRPNRVLRIEPPAPTPLNKNSFQQRVSGYGDTRLSKHLLSLLRFCADGKEHTNQGALEPVRSLQLFRGRFVYRLITLGRTLTPSIFLRLIACSDVFGKPDMARGSFSRNPCSA